MSKLLLIFILINFLYLNQSADALSKSVCNCRTKLSGRIIGGHEVGMQEYPWQISLGIKPDTPWEIKPEKFKVADREKLPSFFKTATHTCGGVILSDNLILTAAHCVTDDTLAPRPAKGLGVGIGNDLNLVNIYNKGRIQVDKIFVHPDYNVSGKDTTHDIAIVRLAERIDFESEGIRPACLLQETGNGIRDYGEITATGWGSVSKMNFNYITRTWSGYKASLQLKEATFKDISSESSTCKENNKLICIGPVKEGESVCKGDSGGPLHYRLEGNTFVVGVTSFGSTKKVGPFEIQACVKDAGYTRVSSSMNWIKSIVSLNDVCLFEQESNGDKLKLSTEWA